VDDEVNIVDSPGGFTFCFVPWEDERTVPGPLLTDGAGASRVAQLTLDVPPERYEREIAFWAALTGWVPRPGPVPEYTFLARPAGLPAGLLLQRREAAAPDDRVRGHVDLECDDTRRTADWHASLGARADRTCPWGIVMADPVGRPYCLTSRSS
jgi:glyoxalase superfamily protein